MHIKETYIGVSAFKHKVHLYVLQFIRVCALSVMRNICMNATKCGKAHHIFANDNSVLMMVYFQSCKLTFI